MILPESLSHHHLPDRVRTDDGVELRYRVHGDRGSPMLIMNGLLSTILHWRRWVEHFEQSHRVITWDYPGHGESPRPPDLSVVSIEAFAGQAHDVKIAASDGKKVIVCGLSMGVQVALEHYRRHPDDVRALVLICGTYGTPLNRIWRSPAFQRGVAHLVRTAGRSERALRAILWPFVATPLGREMAFLTGGAHRKDCPASVLDELFAHVHRLDVDVIIEASASYLLHTAVDVLDSVRVPTLIIAGGHDQLTPASVSEEMHHRIAGSELHVVKGRTHLAQVEEPATVHALVERFISRLPSE